MGLKYEPASEPLHDADLLDALDAQEEVEDALVLPCYSQKATMGRELMAPRTDRTTRIPSGVASPVATNHAAKGSVFVN